MYYFSRDLVKLLMRIGLMFRFIGFMFTKIRNTCHMTKVKG